MFDCVQFAERLKDLMIDARVDALGLSEKLNVTKVTVYRYLNGSRVPKVDLIVSIADLFSVTLDYLLGIKPESYTSAFKICPPFSDRLAFLLAYFKTTKYRLEKVTGIDDESISAWLKGKHKPSVENVIKLAEFFNCSVDFVLGRE